jgi:hypothetical protein
MFRQATLSIALGCLLVSVSAFKNVPTSFVLVGDSTTANGCVIGGLYGSDAAEAMDKHNSGLRYELHVSSVLEQ